MSMMEQTAGSSFSVSKAFAAPFQAIGNALMYIAENNVRVKQLQALSALTDEQLEERGLKREELVIRVFGGSGI
ncbi:hypothetical protein [Actibacterium pelagium]|uniref:DUF1127 domain-containing protein n=1 Tax=Actibacterium pelagium TaxID=2029103 RepID=A0A917AKM8_9RHOB|nr:hypothetical protein [Actibacterium pelagium]GGE57519.1 hypothetical protein GCM10011517_26630 [Actibacterium pelagium]